MDGRKRLPDAELSVMQAVWAHGGEVSRGDIEGALGVPRLESQHHQHLSHAIVRQGLSERAPRGTQQLLYAARFAGEVPRVRQPKRPGSGSTAGSLGSFVAALTAEKPLAQSEIDELRRYLDEMSGKAGE